MRPTKGRCRVAAARRVPRQADPIGLAPTNGQERDPRPRQWRPFRPVGQVQSLTGDTHNPGMFRASVRFPLQHVIPVSRADRPKALDQDAASSGNFAEALGVAITGPVCVGRRNKTGAGMAGDGSDCVLQSGDRSRPDATTCGEVERISTWTLYRGQAQCVDRRLGDGEPTDPLPCPAEPEQRLGPAPQGSFLVRTADLDVSDTTILAPMGKPRVAEGTIPHDIRLGRSRQNRSRNATLPGQVRPGGRSLSWRWPALPALSDRTIRHIGA